MKLLVLPEDGMTAVVNAIKKAKKSIDITVFRLDRAEITAEDQSDIKEGLGFFNTFLLTFALIALFVGSFIIYNSFSILVAQRGRDMALLRAIGASRRQVLGSVLLEAVVVGLIAAGVVLLALLAMKRISRRTYVPFGPFLIGGALWAALIR